MDNIILTIYYANSLDPQRNILQKKDNFGYIEKFYKSVVKTNMHAIIFHDGLTKEFVQKYQNDNIKFMIIPDNKYGMTSMNDIRFMVYLEYLNKNKNLKKIIISDGADVEFNKNIFDDITENKLYVCYDRDRIFTHYYLANRIKLTYLSMEPFNKIMDCKALQAGLFGGNYSTIIECLNHMKFEFETMVDKRYNCNYIVFNHVAYHYMYNKLRFSKPGQDIKTKCAKEIKYLTWGDL